MSDCESCDVAGTHNIRAYVGATRPVRAGLFVSFFVGNSSWCQ